MARGFFKLLVDSFKGFKENFPVILILFILLSVIPSLILAFIGLPMINMANPINFYATNQGIIYLILSVLFMLVSALLSASILVLAFSNKKLAFKEAISAGSRYWLSYIALYIMLSIFLVVVTIPSIVALYFAFSLSSVALMILGFVLFLLPIYFAIKLVLSLPVLVAENRGAFNSLKRSLQIVRGKFWKTAFYLVLLAIILFVITQVFGSIGYYISSSTGNISLATDATTNTQTTTFTHAGFFINLIFALAASLLTSPLSFFFLKNLYQDEKEGTSEKADKPAKTIKKK